jgi:Ca-activated chloride channel family protein
MMRSGLFGSQGGEAVPLLGVDVRAEVVAGHACAFVRQRYRNSAPSAIEAVYTFPLPSKAVLTGFSMSVDGRRMEGEVHEREEAFRRYDDAITTGHGAALLEQERPNVFTANVGNLLPGEETIIEVQYIEPVVVDEGAVRWSIPTLVAPRYIPGTASGDRTAHGTADPTDRVTDADRITPPVGAVSYGLALDLTFDLGVALDVESPAHALVVTQEGTKARVTFAQREVALDRDVVVTAFAKSTSEAALANGVCDRTAGMTGTFALTFVPDLALARSKQARASVAREIVFVLDRSGSMGGSSMPEARTALRLCLRQLCEGDRFGILAFDDTIESFAPTLVPFTEATLRRADAWLAAIDARGGTELLTPMLAAAELLAGSGARGRSRDGIVVLLTDGQVGNEDEILAKFVSVARGTRVYSFGIGTNVSDVLLRALGDKTGGAVEMIHPGERLDEKVVAQLARATAPRVTDVTIKARGIELSEVAPAEAPPLVEGEPYCVFGTYEQAGHGVIEIRGRFEDEAFYVEVPVELVDHADRPAVPKLWAQARIRDLERANLAGRRLDAMKDRIVKLAIAHGVSSKYTSFVVVEKRTGERRATTQPETRVVPVNAPAGWAMFQGAPPQKSRVRAMSMTLPGAAPSGTAAPPRASAVSAFASRPAAAPAPAPARAFAARLPPPRSRALSGTVNDDHEVDMVLARARPMPPSGGDAATAILSRQSASGLWEQPGRDAVSVSVEALLVLLRLGLSTAHPVHAAQLKKALDALLAQLRATPPEPRVLELALGIAWLLASGRRTRHAIEAAAAASGAAFGAAFGSDSAVRAVVDRLAPE